MNAPQLKRHLQAGYNCSMSDNENKNQHYIPQFLLRQFTDGNGILYRHKRGAPGVCNSTPKQSFRDSYLYRLFAPHYQRDPDGLPYSDEVDLAFQRLESQAAPVITRIIELCGTRSQDRLESWPFTEKDSRTVKMFFQSMWRRTPESMAAFTGDISEYGRLFTDVVNHVLAQFGSATVSNGEIPSRILGEALRTSKIRFAGAANSPLMKSDVKSFIDTPGLLVCAIRSCALSFVIGSKAVVDVSMTVDGKPSDKVTWLPLAKDVALSATPFPDKPLILHDIHSPSSRFVKHFNRCTAQQSGTIAGPSADLVQSLLRHRTDSDMG